MILIPMHIASLLAVLLKYKFEKWEIFYGNVL